jgi:hypothetical protein
MGLNSVPYSYSATGSECVAETMVQMLQGNRGWSFDLPPKNQNWKWFSNAPNLDDWSMLINHLLERSFSSPVKVLQAAGKAGGHRRSNHRLYLKAQAPSGAPMFFFVNGDEVGPPNLMNWVSDASSAGASSLFEPVWNEVEEDSLLEPGGDTFNPPPELPSDMDEGSGEGPISVVCFEFSPSRND